MTKFIDALRALPNQSIWKDLEMNGDGDWVKGSLTASLLIMVHDGSCNEGLDPTKSAAA